MFIKTDNLTLCPHIHLPHWNLRLISRVSEDGVGELCGHLLYLLTSVRDTMVESHKDPMDLHRRAFLLFFRGIGFLFVTNTV